MTAPCRHRNRFSLPALLVLVTVLGCCPPLVRADDPVPPDNAEENWPPNKRNWLSLGWAFYLRGDLDKAVDAFSQAIKLDPKYVHGYTGRGQTWQSKGQLDNAIQDFSEAIAIDPHSEIAHYCRATAWQAKGQFDNAIDDYAEAITIDPQSANAHFGRATAWQAKGELENAIKDYTEAITIDPQSADAHACRGNAWGEKGEPEKATEDFDEALRIAPKHTSAYNNRALLRATFRDARYRDGNKAVADATKACELTDWKDQYSIDTLAAAYAEKGEFEQAIEWETKAIDMAASEKDKAELRAHLDLFKAGMPYRNEPKR